MAFQTIINITYVPLEDKNIRESNVLDLVHDKIVSKVFSLPVILFPCLIFGLNNIHVLEIQYAPNSPYIR